MVSSVDCRSDILWFDCQQMSGRTIQRSSSIYSVGLRVMAIYAFFTGLQHAKTDYVRSQFCTQMIVGVV
jgi:hypothetical protein